MNTKTIINYSILGFVLLVFFIGCSSVVGTTNNEVKIRNQFTQKEYERTTFYEKMSKTISQKAQVTLKNDTAFQNVVNKAMTARTDGAGILMKWIQEQNPTSNFGEVSALYKDLSRTIEAERIGFFDQEKTLQDIKREHDDLLGLFPSNIILSIFGRNKPLNYIPVTSDRTDDVMKTHKDNNINVFE